MTPPAKRQWINTDINITTIIVMLSAVFGTYYVGQANLSERITRVEAVVEANQLAISAGILPKADARFASLEERLNSVLSIIERQSRIDDAWKRRIEGHLNRISGKPIGKL